MAFSPSLWWKKVKTFLWNWTPTWIKNTFWPNWQNSTNSPNQQAAGRNATARQDPEINRSLEPGQFIERSQVRGGSADDKHFTNSPRQKKTASKKMKTQSLNTHQSSEASPNRSRVFNTNLSQKSLKQNKMENKPTSDEERFNKLVKEAEARNLSTALYAAQYGSPEDIKLLLQRGYDKVNDIYYPGRRTLLHYACLNMKGPENITALLDAGANKDAKDASGKTPLAWATIHGTPTHIQTLINAGADIEAQDNYGWTPLHIAAEGMSDIGKFLKHDSPPYTTILKNTVATFQILLKAGADPSKTNNASKIPIDLASNIEITNLLSQAQEKLQMFFEDKWQERVKSERSDPEKSRNRDPKLL